MIACAESAVRVIHVLLQPYIRALSYLAEIRKQHEQNKRSLSRCLSFYHRISSVAIMPTLLVYVVSISIKLYCSILTINTYSGLKIGRPWKPHGSRSGYTVHHIYTSVSEFLEFFLHMTFCNNFINFQPMTTYDHSF